jgi:hypothetical protein
MRAVILALTLLAGCATAPPLPPPAVTVPDLRGTWTGTWGGTPLTLVVIDQTSGPGESGVMLGPWQVLGESYPTLRGVITASIDGVPTSTHMDGLLAGPDGRLVVALRARSAAGEHRLQLRLVEAERLEGAGDSQFAWGPRGPVQLVRQSRPRAVRSSPARATCPEGLVESAHSDGRRACPGSTRTT